MTPETRAVLLDTTTEQLEFEQRSPWPHAAERVARLRTAIDELRALPTSRADFDATGRHARGGR